MTAVDFVLEPDETMLERARIVNARRLGVYPQGFQLDAALCHSGAKAEGRRPETACHNGARDQLLDLHPRSCL